MSDVFGRTRSERSFEVANPNLRIELGDTSESTKIFVGDTYFEGVMDLQVHINPDTFVTTATITALLSKCNSCERHTKCDGCGNSEKKQTEKKVKLPGCGSADVFIPFCQTVNSGVNGDSITITATCGAEPTTYMPNVPACICTPEKPVFGASVNYETKGLYDLVVDSECKKQTVLEKYIDKHQESVNKTEIDPFRKPGPVKVEEPLKQSDLNVVHNRYQNAQKLSSQPKAVDSDRSSKTVPHLAWKWVQN